MDPSPPDDAGPPLDFAAISTHTSALKSTNRLVLRYSDAILAYATVLLRNREEAEDVHMHVVQTMLEGRLSRAAAPRGVREGRFRFYVQRTVRHAVFNHVRQRTRQHNLLQRFWNTLSPMRDAATGGTVGPAAAPADADLEEAERAIWRGTVLSRAVESALKELAGYQQQQQDRGRPNVYHTLARLLVERPEEDTEQLARRLGEQVGGSFNAGQVRGIVLRMRRKLAELLVAEIIPQVDDPTPENVLAELADLGLLDYVRPYLPPTSPPGAA
jgi:DNA-directed RNA polymerase specialized sigma24 family protein